MPEPSFYGYPGYEGRRRQNLFAPPGYGYDVYLPMAGGTYVPPAPWGQVGGQYPEERALTPAQWSPAQYAWQPPPVPGVGVGGAGFAPAATAPAGGRVFSPVGFAQDVGAYGQDVAAQMAELARRAQQQERAGQQPAGGQAGGGRPPRNPAPAGINQQWWDEFAAEHGGQDPSDVYRQSGEGLAEALADKEWGEQFASETGRPPTDDEWRVHWFQTRTGMSQEDRDAYRQRKAARREWKRVTGKKLPWAPRTGQEKPSQRAPTWVPPSVTWQT